MKIVNRIKKSNDFAITIKKGHAANNQSFTVHYLKNEISCVRVGISVSTHIGNAVIRNKCKRQIRAMCDSLIDYSSLGLDLVIIVRKGFLNNDFKTNKLLLSDLFKRTGRKII